MYLDKPFRVKLGPYQYHKLKARKRIQQDNLCAICQRPDPTDLDDIQRRGMGASNRLDTEENTRLLCRWCHSERHSSKQEAS